MIEFFCQLKDRYHLKIAAVSNEGRELTVYRIQKFALGDFIDFFISSCYVHFRKPDADMYRIALDVAQAPPEQTLYVDDRAMFVEVAASLNIRGIEHTGLATTREAFAAYGLEFGGSLAGDSGWDSSGNQVPTFSLCLRDFVSLC